MPTSDSLSGTTSCMELRSVSTAKAELDELVEDEAADAPVVLARAPAAPVADAPVPEEPLEELEELVALVVPLAETSSPTCPFSEAIVPLSGA